MANQKKHTDSEYVIEAQKNLIVSRQGSQSQQMHVEGESVDHWGEGSCERCKPVGTIPFPTDTK